MSTSAEVAGRDFNAGAQQRRAAAPAAVLRPAVDIFEDADGITLYADLPGVSKERLNVRVAGTTLFLEGAVQSAGASQSEAASRLYRRSFALSRELEPDRIEAQVKDGVLTVRIPKRAENRLRRIEIQ